MDRNQKKKLDLQYHLQQAAKASHANKWILEDRMVPISQSLHYFDSVVSSVACFAGGHRTMYQTHGCRDGKRHLMSCHTMRMKVL